MTIENTQKAVQFLKEFIPNGLWVLTAIDPAKKRNIETRTFSAKTEDQAEDWIADRNGVDNLYFSVNQPEQGEYGKKLGKNDIAVVHYLHVDVDPDKGKEIDLQRKQIFDRLTVRRPEAVPRPSVIIDSGGGYQAFWKLEEPQVVGASVQRDSVELFNKWLADMLGGDNCQNIDRIMRLPWTINIPNAQKKQAGRVEALAKPKQIEDISYKLHDFSLEAPEPVEGDQDKPEPKKVDTRGLEDEIAQEIAAGPIFVEEIEDFGKEYEIPRRTLHIIVDGEGDDEEKLKKKQAGKAWTRSEWLFDVVCELERRNVPRRVILGIIMEPNVDKFRISDSVVNNKDYPSPLDYAVRQLRKAAKAVAEARLESDQVAKNLINLDLGAKRLELEKLCRGPRAKMVGVTTREEAEDLDPLLKALNSYLYFVLSVTGKPRVCTWGQRPEIGEGKTVMLEKTTIPDFHLQYKGLKVETGYAKDKDGNDDLSRPTRRPLSEWWIEHTFKNIKKRIAFDPEKRDTWTLNEWDGFTYPEDPNGKYDLFIEHMRENICNGNEEHFTYLKKWCARLYQKPGRVGQIGIFLKGGSGIGKSVFVQVLGNLVESNFFQTSQVKKLSNFNAVLRTTVLLFLDEPSLEANQYDLLKKLLSDNSMDVEAKGYEQETALNCLHILFASNHAKVAQIAADDRRLCIFDVGNKRKNDEAFFGAVFEQLRENDNAGYKALFHYFRNIDLTGFRPQMYPKTEALAEQKELSLTPEEDWFLQKLEEGELFIGSGDWPNAFISSKLREDYIKVMDENKVGERGRLTPRLLGSFVNKTLGLVKDKDKTTHLGQAAYRLPSLPEARASWEKLYGRRAWPEVIEMKEPNKTSKYEGENTPF